MRNVLGLFAAPASLAPDFSRVAGALDSDNLEYWADTVGSDPDLASALMFPGTDDDARFTATLALARYAALRAKAEQERFRGTDDAVLWAADAEAALRELPF